MNFRIDLADFDVLRVEVTRSGNNLTSTDADGNPNPNPNPSPSPNPSPKPDPDQVLGSLTITIDSAKDLLIKDKDYWAKDHDDGKQKGKGSG